MAAIVAATVVAATAWWAVIDSRPCVTHYILASHGLLHQLTLHSLVSPKFNQLMGKNKGTTSKILVHKFSRLTRSLTTAAFSSQFLTNIIISFRQLQRCEIDVEVAANDNEEKVMH